jgi:hypothetical protein
MWSGLELVDLQVDNIDYIDKTTYENMHGKFSIIFDMFSNHYKSNYKTGWKD